MESVWAAMTLGRVGIAVGAFVLTFALSAGATIWIVLRLPVDYFTSERRPLPLEGRPFWVRVAALVARNVAGVFLILLGLVMSLPGVPGQGLLMVLLGIMLTDVPGKRRLERALVRRKLIHAAINGVRERFSKPAIEVPEPMPSR
ncbi:MAG: hypothetical protein JNK04_20445 [Myxococcales bacterium]|nr:hypothetical protein [Myxococcales bacterium]